MICEIYATSSATCLVQSGIYDLVRGADADGNAYIEQGEIKGVKPLFEAPKPKRSAIFEYGEGSMARPWDDWDEWDFR